MAAEKNDTTKNGEDKKGTTLVNKIDASLKSLIERVEDERRGLESKLQETDIYKKAQKFQKDFSKRAEDARAQAFKAAGLATTADIERLNRKLNAIKKDLNA